MQSRSAGGYVFFVGWQDQGLGLAPSLTSTGSSIATSFDLGPYRTGARTITSATLTTLREIRKNSAVATANIRNTWVQRTLFEMEVTAATNFHLLHELAVVHRHLRNEG
jgi:hypothetical protein